jgi:hypothetical protein
MIESAIADGYDEIQVPRVSQFTRKTVADQQSSSFTAHIATETSISCMQDAYYHHNKSLASLFECWSDRHLEDKKVNPKSIDISSRCPFHYNHYSCANGNHKAYRREKYRCHCNVKKVDVKECRIVHLNNKFLSDYLDSSSSSSLSVPLLSLSDIFKI